MKIIFCKPDYSYDSYQDFWALVKLSGFPIIPVSEIDYSKKVVYIYSPNNAETKAGTTFPIHEREKHKKKRCRIVHWQIERPDEKDTPEDFQIDIGLAVQKGWLDKVWVSDKSYMKWINSQYIDFVVLGSHPDLNPHRAATYFGYKYEIATLMASYGRRQAVLTEIKNKYEVCPNGFGNENAEYLIYTAIMLNVHKDKFPIIEPLRFAKAAAFNMCLISETCEDPYPLVDGVHFIGIEYDNILQYLGDVIPNSSLLNFEAVNHLKNQINKMGNDLHELLCRDYEFGKVIKKAVKDLLN